MLSKCTFGFVKIELELLIIILFSSPQISFVLRHLNEEGVEKQKKKKSTTTRFADNEQFENTNSLGRNETDSTWCVCLYEYVYT